MSHLSDARNQLVRDYNRLMELQEVQADRIRQLQHEKNIIAMANQGLRFTLEQQNRQKNIIVMANQGLRLTHEQQNRQQNAVRMANQGLRLMLEQRNQESNGLNVANRQLRRTLNEQRNTEAALGNEIARLTNLVNGQNQERQLLVQGFKSVKDKADQAENLQRQCNHRNQQIRELEAQNQAIQRQHQLIQNERIQLVDRVKYLDAHIQAKENQKNTQIRNLAQGFETRIQQLQDERNKTVQHYQAQIQSIQNQTSLEANHLLAKIQSIEKERNQQVQNYQAQIRLIQNQRAQDVYNLGAQIKSIVHERNQRVQDLELILNEKNKLQAKMKSIQNLKNQIVRDLETEIQLKQSDQSEEIPKKNNKQTKNQAKEGINIELEMKEKQINHMFAQVPPPFNGLYLQRGKNIRIWNLQNQKPASPNPEQHLRRVGRVENNFSRGNHYSKQNQIQSLSQQKISKNHQIDEQEMQKAILATVELPKKPTQKQIKSNYEPNQNMLEPKQVIYDTTRRSQINTLEQFFQSNQRPINRNPPSLTPFYDKKQQVSYIPYNALLTAVDQQLTFSRQNFTYSAFPNQDKKQKQKPNKNVSLEQKPSQKERGKIQQKKCPEKQQKTQPRKPNAVVDERQEIENQLQWSQFESQLQRVDQFPNLKKMILRSKSIANSGLIVLAQNGHKLTNLQLLSLHSNGIGDRGIKIFAENGNKFPNLQQIYLGNNTIKDEGLKALVENGKKFKNIKQIHLQNNCITDEGLTFLAQNGSKFQKLENVYLAKNDIKITNSGLMSLLYEYNLKFTISK